MNNYSIKIKNKPNLNKSLFNEIKTSYLNETLKLGYSGSLQVIENNLKANQFEISLGDSKLYLDGICFNGGF